MNCFYFKGILLIFSLLFSHSFFVQAAEPWDESTANAFESGDGSVGNPYKIKTAAQFAYFAKYTLFGNSFTDKYFELIDDIDLNNKPFFCVGFRSSGYDPFKGYFDGNNHKIKGLKLSGSNAPGVGLFAFVEQTYSVKNLIIESGIIEVSAHQPCGAFVGFNDGTILNCHNYATVKTSEFSIGGDTSDKGVGGIVGHNKDKGKIVECSNYGEITNQSSVEKLYTGGIVGYDDGESTSRQPGAVTQCMNFGKISSKVSYVGGIIGKSRSKSWVEQLVNFGDISSSATSQTSSGLLVTAGGIVGRNHEDLKNCINRGNISKVVGTDANVLTGGITGELNGNSGSQAVLQYSYNTGHADFGISPTAGGGGANLKNLYYDADITAKGYGSPNTNVVGKSPDGMKVKAFLDLLNDNQDPKPWIFCTQLNDGYPVMKFMVKKITFAHSSPGIIVKSNGQTVKDSVWLGSKVEFSLSPGYQWESGETDVKSMYAADDIIFPEKAIPTPYNIIVTSNYTASEISVKGFINDIEQSGWSTGKIVDNGSSVSLEATSSDPSKYVFVRWEENGSQVSTDNPYTFTASNNRNIVARFNAFHKITVTSDIEASEISVKGFVNDIEQSDWSTGETIIDGGSVRLEATSSDPNKYFFAGWKENESQVSTDSPYTFTASNNRHIVAHFKHVYRVNIEKSVGGTITPNNHDFVVSGTTVTFTITPDAGYQIQKITLKNISGESEMTFTPSGYILTFSVESNSEINVVFEEKTTTDVDNISNKTTVYSNHRQIFVETFEPASITGYSIMGQIVFTSQNNAGSVESYDVPSPGIYFVKVQKQQRTIVKKIAVH